jgi:hypothetical protein
LRRRRSPGVDLDDGVGAGVGRPTVGEVVEEREEGRLGPFGAADGARPLGAVHLPELLDLVALRCTPDL